MNSFFVSSKLNLDFILQCFLLMLIRIDTSVYLIYIVSNKQILSNIEQNLYVMFDCWFRNCRIYKLSIYNSTISTKLCLRQRFL